MARNDDGEEYDKCLQDLMQDCLPNILVEIVEQRPPDPIAFMANSLYRYRGREPPVSYIPPNTHTGVLKGSENLPPVLPARQSTSKRTETSQESEYKIVQVNDDFDECIYDMDLKVTESRNTKVHDSLLGLFKYMGDLFDDDDLS